MHTPLSLHISENSTPCRAQHILRIIMSNDEIPRPRSVRKIHGIFRLPQRPAPPVSSPDGIHRQGFSYICWPRSAQSIRLVPRARNGGGRAHAANRPPSGRPNPYKAESAIDVGMATKMFTTTAPPATTREQLTDIRQR